MDEVNLTRAQLKALVAKDADIVITAVNTDQRLVRYERTQYRGKPGEAHWMMGNGKNRADR